MVWSAAADDEDYGMALDRFKDGIKARRGLGEYILYWEMGTEAGEGQSVWGHRDRGWRGTDGMGIWGQRLERERVRGQMLKRDRVCGHRDRGWRGT